MMHRLLIVAGFVVTSVLLWPFAMLLARGWGSLTAAALAVIATGLAGLTLALLLQIAPRSPRAAVGVVLLALALLGVLLRVATGVTWGWALAGTTLAMLAVGALLLTTVLLIAALRFVAALLGGLHANGYGICSGRTAAGGSAERPGLTDWLTGYFDRLAGLPSGRHPLTFGDLWGTVDVDAPRRINLEVMTSAVSQQMVYGIPFRKGTPAFHYDPEEWARLFPPSVMEWLDQATVVPDDSEEGEPTPPGLRVVSAAGRPLRALPRRADLPVVVAVRMSLSFPILLSAVPLHAVDWSRTDNQARRQALRDAAKAVPPIEVDVTATRIWFSDGGIGSNMPLHMFDALLPSHPTFAVNLKTEHPDYPVKDTNCPGNEGGRVYLPDSNVGGRIRYWPAPADALPLGGLIGFLSSIVDTMQNWRDEIMFPYPGFRDRIVQISQRAGEGGLNLDMDADKIQALAKAGEMAALRLTDRFHPAGKEQGKGWDNHLQVRLRTFLATMQPGSAALYPSLSNGTWTQCIPRINGLTQDDSQLATNFLTGLQALGALSLPPGRSLEACALKPLAQLRIAPRI
jgi:hypothetical protein